MVTPRELAHISAASPFGILLEKDDTGLLAHHSSRRRRWTLEFSHREPLLQAEVYPLMTRLADAGKTVLLETSGAVDTTPVDPRVRIILDIKTPGSGEVGANVWSNLDRLKPIDEVKVVVRDRRDFDWAAEIIRTRRLTERCPVLLSASFGQVNPTELAAWILESRLPVRLQLQQHKILWDPNARGV